MGGSASADFDAPFCHTGLAASVLDTELSRRLCRLEAAIECAFSENSMERQGKFSERPVWKNVQKKKKKGQEKNRKSHLPPPCTQQCPEPPTADLLQELTEHLLPPPCPAQNCLSLAPLSQPSTVHLRPPDEMRQGSKKSLRKECNRNRK